MISICIPTLNRADLLRKNLEHLLTFSELDVEVNISNNGSNDHTQKVIEEYRSKFPKFNSHTYEETVSVVRNWDNVIRMATEKYVFALGDDDNSLEEGLLAAVSLMESNEEIGAVYGGYKEFSLEEKFLTDTKKSNEVEFYDNSKRLELLSKHWSFEVPVFRRDIYERFGRIHDNSWVLSWTFLNGIFKGGNKIAVTPFFFFKHYIHKNRVTEKKAADAHMNFSGVSEVEIFLADTNIRPQDKFNFLFNYLSQLYNFQAQVCLRNSDFLQARFFINKGFLYNPEHFKKLVQIWDQSHLIKATFQEIRARIASKVNVERVVILSSKEREQNFISEHLKEQPLPLATVTNLDQLTYSPNTDFLLAFDEHTLSNHQPRSQTAAFTTIMDSLKFTQQKIHLNLEKSTSP